MFKFLIVVGVIIFVVFLIENGNVLVRLNSLIFSLYNEIIVKDNIISVIENVGYILVVVDVYFVMCD